MFYNPVCFAYYKSADFVKKCIALKKKLDDAEDATLNNFDYWKKAFLYEMASHEYHINSQGDYDVIHCFKTPFNEVQKKAYRAAKTEYYNRVEQNGML